MTASLEVSEQPRSEVTQAKDSPTTDEEVLLAEGYRDQ